MTDELHDAGEKVSRKRVIRLMQGQALCALVPKKFNKTTDSKHDLPVAENVVARDVNPDAPNKLWAADISYVRTWQGWLTPLLREYMADYAATGLPPAYIPHDTSIAPLDDDDDDEENA